MLVLTRQLDESIMIGDDIVITLVDIQGDRIRLGIAAPNDVPVHRLEVYELMQRENFEAAFQEAHSTPPPTPPAAAVPFHPRSLKPKQR